MTSLCARCDAFQDDDGLVCSECTKLCERGDHVYYIIETNQNVQRNKCMYCEAEEVVKLGKNEVQITELSQLLSHIDFASRFVKEFGKLHFTKTEREIIHESFDRILRIIEANIIREAYNRPLVDVRSENE